MPSFTIDATLWRPLCVVAADPGQLYRPQMEWIHFEPARVVATDGARIVVAEIDHPMPDGLRLRTPKPGKRIETVRLDKTGQNEWSYQFQRASGTTEKHGQCEIAPSDTPAFPDWQPCIGEPQETAEPPIALNAALLADVQAAASAKGVVLRQGNPTNGRGHSPYYVDFIDGPRGLRYYLMEMRP